MEGVPHPVIPDEQCTLATCSLLQAHFRYLPSLPGNALYLAIFALLIAPQVFFGIKHKTWGYMIAMLGGLALEVIGYIARVMMHSNPFTQDNFLMYIVTLTIGPAFFAAAIYLCLGRIIMVYGEQLSRFRPRVYTITFISFDFLSLILQAAGGAITSSSNDQSGIQTGVNVMLAGLGMQVASMTAFIGLCIELTWRLSKNQQNFDPAYAQLRASTTWKVFLVGLVVATITVFVRCCFRVAELSQGFTGKLANQEVSYMILEGAMIIIACIALTIPHPGVAFQGVWSAANFKVRRSRNQEKEMESGSVTPQ